MNANIYSYRIPQYPKAGAMFVLLFYSHLISAGGEFDFSLVRLPAHDCELGQLCFLKKEYLLLLEIENEGKIRLGISFCQFQEQQLFQKIASFPSH